MAHQNSWETQASQLHPSSGWRGMTQVSQMSGRNTTNVKPVCNHAPLTCTGQVKVQWQLDAADAIYSNSLPLPPLPLLSHHTHFSIFFKSSNNNVRSKSNWLTIKPTKLDTAGIVSLCMYMLIWICYSWKMLQGYYSCKRA